MRVDRGVDVALAAVTIVLVGIAVAADLGDGAGPGVVAYGFAVGLGGLMLVRRRFPVGTLLATALGLLLYYRLGQPPIGLAVPAAASLFSAAERGRTRWAAGVAAALLLVSTLVRLVQGDDPALLLGYQGPADAALMVAAVASGAAVRARRGWREELGRREVAARWEREREAAERVERERLRIARDLHDLLAHTTSVIALHTDVARESLRDDPAAAERSLTVVRAACSSVTRELRATLGALRATAGPAGAEPLAARLDTLVEQARSGGLRVGLEVSAGLDALPEVTATTAFHVVREALTNALRHAGAARVEVVVAVAGDTLTLRVADDGAGSAATSSEGWGIVGMRERVALTGGVLTAGPAARGFVVEASVPLPSGQG